MKKGMTTLTTSIVLCISIAMLTITTIFVINLIIPFITYQKIDKVASKYMFVIEKFGYLTDGEYNTLIKDLEKENLKKENFKIDYPKEKLDYGTSFVFSIDYEYKLKLPITLKDYEAIIPIRIKKYAYSKV